jgi:hypothetical protein
MKLSASKNNSRRRFLNTCGSVLAVGGIAGVSAVSLFKSANKNVAKDAPYIDAKPSDATSYRQTASFGVDGDITGFDLWNDQLVVAVQNNIHIYSSSGNILRSFSVGNDLRDIAVHDGHLYLLFPAWIEVRKMDGAHVGKWEACNKRSDYCSFTVASGSVFVTDAANKEICKYGVDGSFIKTIKSPNRFVIPSYTFGIAAVGDILYCSNSGRHQVEMFTVDGEYTGAFGQPGAVAGRFCGCCNPVHLTGTPDGNIITSEKGNPRISCYGRDGQFRSVLLDSKALGGGNKACDVKMLGDQLVVAVKNTISTFHI